MSVPEPMASDPTSPYGPARSARLAEVAERLSTERGPAYWKSLEAFAGDERVLEAVRNEYPSQAELLADPVARRSFLQLMGASLGLAGLGACTRQPREGLVPWGAQPEASLPGVPRQYASVMPWAAGALGVLVTSHDGRPTKIEGNPDHPASRGATDVFGQTAILDLYDPDRSQTVLRRGRISTWSAFATEIRPELESIVGSGSARGSRVRLLTPIVASPTLTATIERFLAEHPGAKWHRWEPINHDAAEAGSRALRGADAGPLTGVPIADFAQADVILALDGDFLAGPTGVKNARAFAERRRARDGASDSNRLYALESTPTLTGAAADHRLPCTPARLQHLAVHLARALGVDVGSASEAAAPTPEERAFLDAAAADLRAAGPRALIHVGETASATLHALALAIHSKVGARGVTVRYRRPPDPDATRVRSDLGDLVRDLRAGEVDVLAILGANPVYDAPADLDFAGAMERAALRIHLGLYEDETSQRCHWHLPEAHWLEAWGDARSLDGTVAIQQPLIAPLYDGRSAIEVVEILAGRSSRRGHDVVREHWLSRLDGGEKDWRRSLHEGVVVRAEREVWVSFEPQAPDLGALPSLDGGLELALRPCPNVHDGRFANNGWLQELPRPLTKLTWDNVALLAPADAHRLDVRNGDVVKLERGGASIEIPAWVQPGQAPGCVTVHLGYGRTHAGRVGDGVGVNAYPLTTAAEPFGGPGLQVTRTGERRKLAATQEHHSMEGRDLIRETTAVAYAAGATGAPAHVPPHEGTSLYPDWKYDGVAWGMVIDLAACVGCNACVVACQAENNIPIVGKEQVAAGREMHWIRIDRYFAETPDRPKVRFQPIPCMHCENAPCEVVCPVAATTHSPEGLNEMTYNRCVGTRYCSNNCPYKVRRFNFLLYTDWTTPSLKLQRNPDVTVRSRGVMEKCTYCVQRLNRARIDANKAERPLADGEAVTACQQVCPSQAIVFGDINDPASGVARARRQPQHYGLLEELNTRPRTTYLARVDNPNQELEPRKVVVHPPAGSGH